MMTERMSFRKTSSETKQNSVDSLISIITVLGLIKYPQKVTVW